MKKFVIFLLIFAFCPFVLVGCDQKSEIELDDYIFLNLDYQSDKVSFHLYFSVDESGLSIEGGEIEKQKFLKNLEKNIETIRMEYLFSLALIYIQNPIEEYKINSGVLISPVIYSHEKGLIGFDINYTSHSAYRYYHGSSSSSEDNKNQGNIFLYKHSSVGRNPFSVPITISQGQTILTGERYKNMVIESFSGTNYSQEYIASYNPSFVYDYSCPYSYIKTDADVKLKQDDTYHNYWIEKELESKTITLTLQYLNLFNCQVFILATVLIGTTGALITCKIIKKKKSKSKSQEKINDLDR